MQKNLRILTLLLALLLLATLSSKGQTDPGTPDTLRVDSVTAFISGMGIVPVHFYNDEPLFGLEMTLRHTGVGIKIDSFSFVGGRVEAVSIKNRLISDDSTIITVSVLESSGNIPIGSGLLGELFLSYDGTVSPQVAQIDSFTWSPDVIEYSTFFLQPSLAQHMPIFRKGYLNLAENPPSFDSLWVTDGDGVAGQPMAVDIHLFNERDVRDVSVALTWRSDRLTFDSLSFTGMRSSPAQSKFVQYSNVLHQFLTQLTFGESTPLEPGTGLLLKAWFTVDPSTPDTTIEIDTAAFAGVQQTVLILTAVDGNREVVPIYHKGTMQISVATDVNDGENLLPQSFALGQNYPNPFNPTTYIEFALPRASDVRLDIYDITGRLVRTLVDQPMAAGDHRVEFDGRSSSGVQIATGVYFYRIQAGDYKATRKMLLMK